MKTYEAGNKVKGGFYWSKKSWDITVVNGRDGKLPGEGNFVRIPAFLLLIFAPLLGGLYVLFLPFIGFALLAQFAYHKVSAMGRTMSEEVGAAMGPRLAPGVVTFTPSEETEKADLEKTEKAEKPEAEKTEKATS